MNTENFIAGLIDKYAQIPGYPFAPWAEDVLHFNAVRAFFCELFEAAAGDAYFDYADVIEPRMSADFSPYDVALQNRQKRVAFYPDLTSAGFLLATNVATDDYRTDQIQFGEMPDRSWFTIGCDFDVRRLVAVFEMVKIYTHTPFTTLSSEKQMDRNLIKSYGHLFDYPASKRKARKHVRR